MLEVILMERVIAQALIKGGALRLVDIVLQYLLGHCGRPHIMRLNNANTQHI